MPTLSTEVTVDMDADLLVAITWDAPTSGIDDPATWLLHAAEGARQDVLARYKRAVSEAYAAAVRAAQSGDTKDMIVKSADGYLAPSDAVIPPFQPPTRD